MNRKQSQETALRHAKAEIKRLEALVAYKNRIIDSYGQLRRTGQEMAHILFVFSGMQHIHKNDWAAAMLLQKQWDNEMARQK